MTMRVDLSSWPGAALQVRPDGVIEASNGKLETLLGGDAVGRPLRELLDEGSSTGKWERLRVAHDTTPTFELIFVANGIPLEPRAFSLIASGDELYLVEHPAHPRLAELAAEVAATNTDLAVTQRSLVIERARLAAALKELERSNTALDEFAHAVSHDLKAPLRAIKDSAEVLGEDATTDDRSKHSSRIVDQVSRMRRMIDGVFEYARVGRTSTDVSEIDTRQSIAEMVEYLAPPPSIRVEISPDLPVISGERVPFYQVFRNLLSNAFTYRRGEGAEVHVTARPDGQYVIFSVADNGPGISDAQQTRMWRLFQTSRPGEGTGIGLAVVRRLVEAQGGSISVDSVEGQGAAFHVRWPMKPARRGVDRAQLS